MKNLKQNQEEKSTIEQSQKNKRLGRGLDALFASNNVSNSEFSSPDKNKITVRFIPLSQIVPNKSQPRKKIDQNLLKELSQSIAENGILQPILLQKSKLEEKSYSIIAGERRFRASKMAGLQEVPSILMNEENEKKVFQVALLENIQRSDLSILEEARAYALLINDFKCTHEELSKKLGKNRCHITNSMRILKLPESVLSLLENKDITFGHAKIIVGTEDPELWAQIVIEKKLTVRMLENEITENRNGYGNAFAEDLTNKAKSTSAVNGLKESFRKKFREIEKHLKQNPFDSVGIKNVKDFIGDISTKTGIPFEIGKVQTTNLEDQESDEPIFEINVSCKDNKSIAKLLQVLTKGVK